MVKITKNVKNGLHVWCDEGKRGPAVYCNTDELITLFIIRFQVKCAETIKDFIQTLMELDEFIIDDNGKWLTYYCLKE